MLFNPCLLSFFTTAINEVKTTCQQIKRTETGIEIDKAEYENLLTYDQEYRKYLDVKIRLKTFEKTQKTLTPDVDISRCLKAALIKINKPDIPIFSGKARDFAAFKRDFLAIVVPNRQQEQIGLYVKQAVPLRYKHLIANKDLCDCSDMMEIIEEELASSKLIINHTVQEIEDNKTPSSDNEFVKYMDSIEKIIRDLTTVDKLSKIVNTCIPRKLKYRLPIVINRNWEKSFLKKQERNYVPRRR